MTILVDADRGTGSTKSTAANLSRFLRIVEDSWLAGSAFRKQWTRMTMLCGVCCQGPTVPVFGGVHVRQFSRHGAPQAIDPNPHRGN